MVRINEKAPDFSVRAYHKDAFCDIRLSDYKGKWVLLAFYPADFTFICPTELAELADYHERFQKEAAQVLSISRDTAFVHKAWHDHSDSIRKITYPMLADPTGNVCRAYGTYIEDGGDAGLSLRATFLINPEGVVKWYEIHDNTIGRSTAEIFRKLLAAKYVSEHAGQVCPVSWNPGDRTLKPGIDLVGKI